MTRIQSKMCIKCGSSNIKKDEGKFLCGDCGLGFCIFEAKKEHEQ